MKYAHVYRFFVILSLAAPAVLYAPTGTIIVPPTKKAIMPHPNKNMPSLDVQERSVDVAIIGAGVSGLTAGIQTGRSNLKPLIIEGSTPGGGLSRAGTVGNWAGEINISGIDLMEKLRQHANHCGCEFICGEVVRTDLESHPFKLWTDQGQLIKANTIIIASGTAQKKLGCKGEETYFGKGVAICSMCDGPLYKNKKVIVVGGGNSALYEALSLSKFTQDITIVDKHPQLSASSMLQEKIKRKPFIKLKLNTDIEEITGKDDRVTGIQVTDSTTQKSFHIPADGIFVAIGMAPCSQPFGELETDNKGYIKVSNFTKTSIDGIFAAGNIANNPYKQAMAAAGTGCMAAIDAEKYLKKIAALRRARKSKVEK